LAAETTTKTAVALERRLRASSFRSSRACGADGGATRGPCLLRSNPSPRRPPTPPRLWRPRPCGLGTPPGGRSGGWCESPAPGAAGPAPRAGSAGGRRPGPSPRRWRCCRRPSSTTTSWEAGGGAQPLAGPAAGARRRPLVLAPPRRRRPAERGGRTRPTTRARRDGGRGAAAAAAADDDCGDGTAKTPGDGRGETRAPRELAGAKAPRPPSRRRSPCCWLPRRPSCLSWRS
jgi:hypothetical protein